MYVFLHRKYRKSLEIVKTEIFCRHCFSPVAKQTVMKHLHGKHLRIYTTRIKTYVFLTVGRPLMNRVWVVVDRMLPLPADIILTLPLLDITDTLLLPPLLDWDITDTPPLPVIDMLNALHSTHDTLCIM